jgi:uncharacterized protein YbjT (DUF2867 family)
MARAWSLPATTLLTAAMSRLPDSAVATAACTRRSRRPLASQAQARPVTTSSRAAPVNGRVGAGEPAPQHQTSPVAGVRPQVLLASGGESDEGSGIHERHFMSSMQAAVVLGASGSVGRALIEQLIRRGEFNPIVTLVRRSQSDQVALARGANVNLRETLVPTMDPAALETATREAIDSLEGGVVGLSVLGVGARTAKLTIDEHRAVDVHLNAAFARGLKASGRVKHLAFMSAVGADPTAVATGSGAAGMPRYARVKGEAEEAVKESGPAIVSIFRPAMIIGSQHTPWLLEKVLPAFSFATPAKYKSVTIEQIAKAMIATSLDTPTVSAVYHYPEMMALNESLPVAAAPRERLRR